MGMVHEAIDRGGGQGLGHQVVETGRVQVGLAVATATDSR